MCMDVSGGFMTSDASWSYGTHVVLEIDINIFAGMASW